MTIGWTFHCSLTSVESFKLDCQYANYEFLKKIQKYKCLFTFFYFLVWVIILYCSLFTITIAASKTLHCNSCYNIQQVIPIEQNLLIKILMKQLCLRLGTPQEAQTTKFISNDPPKGAKLYNSAFWLQYLWLFHIIKILSPPTQICTHRQN